MNRAILIGRIGRDAETRSFDSGAVKISFSLATSERRRNKDGETVENTEWHTVEMWGERAQKLAQFLTKGKQVMVEGAIRYSQIEENGVKRYFTAINASNVEFLSSVQQQGETPSNAAYGAQKAQIGGYVQTQSTADVNLPPIPNSQTAVVVEEDLPF